MPESDDRKRPPDLAARLRAARERAGLSQEELARRLGMSTKGYRAYEGHRHPDQERLDQIADALGITVAELLVDDGLSGFRRQLAFMRNEIHTLKQRVEELEQHVGINREPAASRD